MTNDRTRYHLRRKPAAAADPALEAACRGPDLRYAMLSKSHRPIADGEVT
jgi:hypothetical protein